MSTNALCFLSHAEVRSRGGVLHFQLSIFNSYATIASSHSNYRAPLHTHIQWRNVC